MRCKRRVSFTLLTCAFVGCRSPEAWRQQADEAAALAIARAGREVSAAPRAFTIERPSDTLRRKLLLPPASTNAPARPAATNLVLTLADCLRVGARHSAEYQDRKEQVFRLALALDLEQHTFESSYAGTLSGAWKADASEEPAEQKATGGATAGLTRRFRNGATFSANLGLDLVKLLTGDGESSLGLLADATVTLPLLKGAGREVVMEPLTQAERELVYGLLAFDRSKAEFAVQIASGCLSVLRAGQEEQIAADAVVRLQGRLARASALGQAGRLSANEVEQTHQDLLRAEARRVSARLQAENRMDALKLTLGLPADASVRLAAGETDRLRERVASAMAAGDTARPEDDDLAQAFALRQDLRASRGRAVDAERQARVAANALRAGLDVTIKAAGEQRDGRGGDAADIRFGDGTASAGVDVDLPWDRTSERNAYRNALLAADKARRDLTVKEDAVKADVRDARRALAEARETYRIQSSAVDLAERRVRSTAMFLDAGRAQTRDVLESEESLVSAQNAMVEAVVQFCLARWALARDTGALTVDDEGWWNMEDVQ